ncbi:MAG: hypothetical protein LBD97_04945, partial [Bifidobacteriaceae bacterium]|nr:hypothetical protein [Bifidobacteriaceae bacterium]
MTASAPTPGQARGASVWKQNRNLIAMLAATIVTVVAIATAVVAATTSGKTEKVAPDSALVELIEAIDRTDRAFWTELQDRGVSNAQATTCETYQPAEASANLDAAAEQLHDAAAAVGIDRLALTESTADQQIKLLLEEPATRVEQARQRLCTGTPGGLTLAATFDRSRQALADLAHKIPPLLANSVLVPQAQAYADAMNPDQPTVLATATPPPDDPRAIALAGLRETVGTFVDDAADGPPILRVIAIVLGAAAVLLWALVILLRTVFATTPAPSAERATAQG